MAQKRNAHKFSGWGNLPDLMMSCEIKDKRSGRVLKVSDQPIQEVMQAIDQKIGRFI